ncbi:hypothetical protein HYPBUDRAFT_235377 [Hyphopichia burtonii NRRL Y-1933]|uniref:Uncharacterized protein n=1 Tax=Hyphopichia burtonii NRRL Y-1933 TaxID=984485 RepID=A0A1E4RCL9_9ASCO|nr:hypothetical protein HYPBUDRAFT_235377 [Hyphopichia burtonii NRRL Y-1933]ODV64986.1 hypothetical protein HYPBUDRAFT_235377 [Hyphopichia burtonii NRRL Y-1933]
MSPNRDLPALQLDLYLYYFPNHYAIHHIFTILFTISATLHLYSLVLTCTLVHLYYALVSIWIRMISCNFVYLLPNL